MALFLKQDFSPPILSRKWLAMKFRPNMLIHSHDNIVAILESGLLFREDSIEVEQGAPAGGGGGWLTRGERAMAAAAAAVFLAALPPKNLSRTTLLRLACLPAIPLAVRLARRRRGSLPALLDTMRAYTALARRAAACLKEYGALHRNLESVCAAVSAARALLRRQQVALAVLLARASSGLLGNAPWLRGDVEWEAVGGEEGTLVQIHHAFLVVQSSLLKHIAAAHFTPSAQTQRTYRNYNERLYWLHTVLIHHIHEEFRQNYEALDRMYRLLKNYGNTETVRTPCAAVSSHWLYADVHAGVARTCLELKMAADKSTSLDVFLDACASSEQTIDAQVLDKDIDGVIELITSALKTAQHAQLRLRKVKSKFGGAAGKSDETRPEETSHAEMAPILTVTADTEPESKDEVFYFVKTREDDVPAEAACDVTAPGTREKENSQVMFNELKRKLVKREDLMRERERQALVNTMPELKGNIPEFPRQITLNEYSDKKGYITKLPIKSRFNRSLKPRTYPKTRGSALKNPLLKCMSVRHQKYHSEPPLSQAFAAKNNLKANTTCLVDVACELRALVLTVWHRQTPERRDHRQSPDELSKKAREKSKERDLSPLSSDSDGELRLLDDVRRYRPVRRKNYPARGVTVDKAEDEPAGYSIKELMDMAAVLQANRDKVVHKMAAEEVFVGYGELSDDSGNEEDA